MSGESMWAPANAAAIIATPPPRTPRRVAGAGGAGNGGPETSNSPRTPGEGSRRSARRGRGRGDGAGSMRDSPSKVGRSTLGMEEPRELLATSQNGSGAPQASSTTPNRPSGDERPSGQDPLQSDLTSAATHSKLRKPNKLALGSQASIWATPAPPDDAEPQAVEDAVEPATATPEAVGLTNAVAELSVRDQAGVPDEAERTTAITVHAEHILEEPPTSARESTFTLDGLTSGTSESSVAGPSTPPVTPPTQSRTLPATDEGASTPSHPTGDPPPPATPGRIIDWADDDDDGLDVDDLAAEWGMATPSSKPIESASQPPAVQPSPTRAARRRSSGQLVAKMPPVAEEKEKEKVASLLSRLGPPPNRTPQPSSTVPLIDRLSPAPKKQPPSSPASALPPKPAGRQPASRQPIELLPAESPTKAPASQPIKHAPLQINHDPAPVVRSPRKERPRPEVRGDAFSRLSKGFLGPGGRGGSPGGRMNGQSKE